MTAPTNPAPEEIEAVATKLREARRWIAAEIPKATGKNVACWCGPGDACHADIILELAPAPTREAVG